MGTLSKERIVDPVLTKYARGYTNAMFVASVLFPLVPVAKEAGKIPQFTKDAFKIYNTERAIRADSNRIDPGINTYIPFTLTEHDLEYPIDYREENESLFPVKLNATTIVTDAIALRKEKLAADMSQDVNNYSAANKLAVAASDKFDVNTSDPIGIIDSARSSVRSQIAKNPNTIVIPESVFVALKNHPAITDKIKYTQHAIITPELLKALLQFEHLAIASAVYENTAGDFVDVWGKNIIIGYVPNSSKSRSYYEPSYGYTLQMKNMPLIDSYSEKGKVTIIRNTDIFTPKIVGADAGFLLTSVIS